MLTEQENKKLIDLFQDYPFTVPPVSTVNWDLQSWIKWIKPQAINFIQKRMYELRKDHKTLVEDHNRYTGTLRPAFELIQNSANNIMAYQTELERLQKL